MGEFLMVGEIKKPSSVEIQSQLFEIIEQLEALNMRRMDLLKLLQSVRVEESKAKETKG